MTPSRVKELWHRRNKNWFIRTSLLAILLLFFASWYQLGDTFAEINLERRLQNLKRFGNEAYPFALRDQPVSLVAKLIP